MDVNGNNTIKKALERRQTTGLPSNFSFRMMEQVRAEALKMERRRKRILSLIHISEPTRRS